jgi:adenine deaminase
MAVINRYEDGPPAIGFIKNFGLQKGAIASSVAHDSHNIIAVGVNDEAIRDAVNLIIEQKGGISLISDEFREVLPLPVAGIMSDKDGLIVAEKYSRLNTLAKKLGTTLSAPYMTLSFMALLVIPQLKLSAKGLFDVQSFTFIDLFVE